MKKKFAVLGDPIDHSWSPIIQKLFAEQFNLSFEYEKIKVVKGSLGNSINELIKKNFYGCNITVPLKQEAYELSIENKWTISKRAFNAKAVNTLCFSKDNFLADNTDGVGLFRDLNRHGLSKTKDAKVLIIGAGGAVRGILPMFSKDKFLNVSIVNRSDRNLQLLSKVFKSDLFEYIKIDNFYAKYPNSVDIEFPCPMFDLIINATSASVSGDEIKISKSIFLECPLIVDLFYSSAPTAFMDFALNSGGLKVIDGLGMLVEQAAESFHIWTENRPSVDEVISNVRFLMSK